MFLHFMKKNLILLVYLRSRLFKASVKAALKLRPCLFSRLFLKIVWPTRRATLLKRRLWHECFPVNFCEISKNTSSGSFYPQQICFNWEGFPVIWKILHITCQFSFLNHHGAEILVIWLVERSAIKLSILDVTREK